MEREVRYIQLPPLPEDIEMPALEAIWLIARMNAEERKDALAQLQAMLGDEEQIEKPDYEKIQTILDKLKTRIYFHSILNVFEIS